MEKLLLNIATHLMDKYGASGVLSSANADGNKITLKSRKMESDYGKYTCAIRFVFKPYKDKYEYTKTSWSGAFGVSRITGYGYTSTPFTATREDYSIEKSDIEKLIVKAIEDNRKWCGWKTK